MDEVEPNLDLKQQLDLHRFFEDTMDLGEDKYPRAVRFCILIVATLVFWTGIFLLLRHML